MTRGHSRIARRAAVRANLLMMAWALLASPVAAEHVAAGVSAAPIAGESTLAWSRAQTSARVGNGAAQDGAFPASAQRIAATISSGDDSLSRPPSDPLGHRGESSSRGNYLAGLGPPSSWRFEDIQDVRISFALPPDVDIGAGDGGDIDGGTRLGLQYIQAFRSISQLEAYWFWGSEVSMHVIDDAGVQAHAVALTGHLGIAYAELQVVHFEANPYAGFGGGRFRGDGADASSSLFSEFGFRLGAFWTGGLFAYHEGFQLGLEVRLQRSRMDDLRGSGLMPFLLAGYRF